MSQALAAAGFVLAPERAEDARQIEALGDRAFGPGRFAKVSYAVREQGRPRPDLGVVAWEGGEVVGSVRQSLISVGGTELVFLGPLAVDASCRGRGLSALLMGRALEAAFATGAPGVLLVGDLQLFARYGFERAPAGRVRLPRPCDPRRVLWRAARPGALDAVSGPTGRPGGS